jgi:hypothetical protein
LQGWLCATSWETGVGSAAFLSGTVMQGLFILNLPDYNPKNWHGTLLIMAISLMANVNCYLDLILDMPKESGKVDVSGCA